MSTSIMKRENWTLSLVIALTIVSVPLALVDGAEFWVVVFAGVVVIERDFRNHLSVQRTEQIR
jgi:hypothetical protein